MRSLRISFKFLLRKQNNLFGRTYTSENSAHVQQGCIHWGRGERQGEPSQREGHIEGQQSDSASKSVKERTA